MVESLSIGALVKMTGISADTIRTWERRYGYPKASRNEAGHRRYDLETCEFLVLAHRLIARGGRPSEVLVRSREEIEAELEPVESITPVNAAPAISAQARGQEFCLSILLKVEQLDGAQVDKSLQHAWNSLGLRDAMAHVVVPLLLEVGDRWEHGRLGVHHEHLFSARLRQFLGQQWQEMSAQAQGPLVAMSTPVGEEHELGLHVAAIYFAMHGCRILFLGPGTPATVLLDAARQAGAEALALSLSSTFPRADALDYLTILGSEYAKHQILIGGFGARHVQEHGICLTSPADVQHWLDQRARVAG